MIDDRKMTEVSKDMSMEVVVAYFKVECWDIRQTGRLRHYFKKQILSLELLCWLWILLIGLLI